MLDPPSGFFGDGDTVRVVLEEARDIYGNPLYEPYSSIT
jgi:hypothetical protein